MKRYNWTQFDEMQPHPEGEWVHIDDLKAAPLRVGATKECETYWARIFIAGPIEVAKQLLREECMREGLCVTIAPTHYVYTGGEESGYVVELNNYPRFPWTFAQIEGRAYLIVNLLLEKTFQKSAMVQFPHRTAWFTTVPE